MSGRVKPTSTDDFGPPRFSADQPHLQAIRLWNDWNVGVAAWGESHHDNNVTLDYLQVEFH
jgi:hypothetical protein